MEQAKTLEKIALFFFRDHVPYLIVPFFGLSLVLMISLLGLEVLSGPLAWYFSTVAVFFVMAVTCLFGFLCKWIADILESRITQRCLAAYETAILKFNNGYGDNLTSEQIDLIAKEKCESVMEKFRKINEVDDWEP